MNQQLKVQTTMRAGGCTSRCQSFGWEKGKKNIFGDCTCKKKGKNWTDLATIKWLKAW